MSLNTSVSCVSRRLGGFGRAALSLKDVEMLYAGVNWRLALQHPKAWAAYRPYRRIGPVPMFKALALPYLIPIESEAGLARELGAREGLRNLCGFGSKYPTRAMLWHFRHTPPRYYTDVMPRLLVSLAVSAREPHLELPFVLVVPPEAAEPHGESYVFRLDAYYPETRIWTTPTEGIKPIIDSAGKTVADIRQELERAEASRPRPGLSGSMPLPAEVSTIGPHGDPIRFAMDRPDWLTPGLGSMTRSKDTVTTLGSALDIPYAACNIIVTSRGRNDERVLLSRRLTGDGAGQYALPGGKAEANESLEACTIRELREETGLIVKRSRPVSLQRLRLPGRPPVLSVGVLVTEFTGRLRTRERTENTRWEWFNLDELPGHLFFPAYVALTDYRRRRFENLRWSDVDTEWQKSAHRPAQLTMDALLAESTEHVTS